MIQEDIAVWSAVRQSLENTFISCVAVCMIWYGLLRYMSLILKNGWIHYTGSVNREML